MKINIGSADRAVRVIAGLALLSLLFLIDTPLRWIGLAGVIPLATAAMRSCPLYSIFGITTCGRPTN